MSLKVTSEIGKLKSVLVHLPGPEIDRMVPSMMEELLFDDILYGNRAREEHRRFQQVLGYVADEVLEIQDLLEEVLEVPEQRGAVLDDLGNILGWGPDMDYRLRDLTAEQLASALITGIEKPAPGIASAAAELYFLPPIPNYFFQRDPLVVVGERAIRGSMATSARLREPLLSGYVMSLHPRFASPEGGKFWFQEFSADYAKPSAYARMRPTLEGGDVLVLRDDLLAIGYSERTEKTTIERLAESLKKLKSPIKRIIVVAIPPERSFMHLDTVFTMISQDECLVYGPMILPDGAEEADVYECDLTKREITWTTEKDLLSALKAAEAGPEGDSVRRRRPDRRTPRAVDGRSQRVRAGAGRRPHVRPQRGDGGRARPGRLHGRGRGGPAARPRGARALEAEEEVRHPARGPRALAGARRPPLHDDAPGAGGPEAVTGAGGRRQTADGGR